MRSLAALSLLVVLAAGCTRAPPQNDSAVVVAAALASWNQRLAAVHDYAVEGEVGDVATKQTLRFRYAMQQPSFSAGELLDATGARARAFVFDGKVLAIVDDATKTVTRQDLSQNEEQMLFTLHEIFSQFVCEGWRPPLIKPQGTTGLRQENHIVLSIPIVDDALASQRLLLKDDGAFVSKELLDKSGRAVSSTRVLEEVVDDGTKLSFPKRWSHTEGASTQEVTLSKIAVNQGVDAQRFSTELPAGFTLRANEAQP
jgi:outer membrane lipoprotein-sorting protein